MTKFANRRAVGVRGALSVIWSIALAGLSATAAAQEFGEPPYVQTPANVVKAMLDTAKVGPEDFIIDLGSGDGRMVITAAKQYGARGIGVDHDERPALPARGRVRGRSRMWSRRCRSRAPRCHPVAAGAAELEVDRNRVPAARERSFLQYPIS